MAVSKEVEPRKYLQVRKDLSSLLFSDFRSLNEPGKVSTAVLWIHLGFNADPDPAFYLNAAPDPGSQTYTDTDPSQTFKSQKVEFLMEALFKILVILCDCKIYQIFPPDIPIPYCTVPIDLLFFVF
jgi:hypothetical protein